ncbi:MAG TPA: hypothetical protein PLU49_04865 [Saprospiraceae bacterium]|nr:hypothetical protein [Saprospiraceae bacterium]
MKSIFPILIFWVIIHPAYSQKQVKYWHLNETGGISRTIGKGETFHDHIEMSGKFISAVIRYGVHPDGSFRLSRELVWPMLRTIPNDTHASLIRTHNLDPVSLVCINGWGVRNELVKEIQLEGMVTVNSLLDNDIALERTLFPSTDKPIFCEKYVITNHRNKDIVLDIPEIRNSIKTLAEQGVNGTYIIETNSFRNGSFLLKPGEKHEFYLVFSARQLNEQTNIPDLDQEFDLRLAFLKSIKQHLVLETPDPVLNQMFYFAKIRAAESIFHTAGGPLHGPGGLRYYAAIWANDQAEYINPLFPYLGYGYGNVSAINAFRHFARFMNPDYKPIPSSIIAEGLDVWNGAGDRGDAAMIAYGASRFALSFGNKEVAKELWPLIEWTLEYCRRQINEQGVVHSDTDELEGRFPSGDANLVTSVLYYDALISAGYLGADIGIPSKNVKSYKNQAKVLRKNIENFFGNQVMGYETYRYFEGNDVLRSWICIPLTVGIFDRKNGTIDALFSPELWTADGLATQSGDKTFWDRATLYGLRGVFAAGETEKGLNYLKYYSERRLLGEHVPYAVEAFPEGNQRHLSAESGLYCRIFTEGLFGIRPVSLQSFELSPKLPAEWDEMSLKNVHGYGQVYDILVKREQEKLRIRVTAGEKIILEKLVGLSQSVEVDFQN